jgi:hypothetical protein
VESGAETKGACGSVQLCAGLEAGIKRVLHLVCLRAETNGSMQFCAGKIVDDLWDIEREEGGDPPWVAEAKGGHVVNWMTTDRRGLTLVDARNGFNELSRYAMLWTARHHWSKGARFAFNYYRHYARCLVRNPGSKPSLLSRDGVTQGCPQSRIMYGLSLLPRNSFAATHPSTAIKFYSAWYADNMAMMGTGKWIARVFWLLREWPEA